MKYLDLIDKYCEQHGLSQNQFELEAGLSKGQVSKWRIRGLYPNVESLIKIADYTGMSIDYMLREPSGHYHPALPDHVSEPFASYVPVSTLDPASPVSISMDLDSSSGDTITLSISGTVTGIKKERRE